MSIMKYYQPWGMLDNLHRDLDNLFSQSRKQTPVNQSDWVPAVDVNEDENQYILHADVPGIKPDDIHVEADKGYLSIQGERKLEQKEEKDGFRRIERSYGSFYRRFELPDAVNTQAISAKTKDGVLEIIIPKTEPVASKKINVEG